MESSEAHQILRIWQVWNVQSHIMRVLRWNWRPQGPEYWQYTAWNTYKGHPLTSNVDVVLFKYLCGLDSGHLGHEDRCWSSVKEKCKCLTCENLSNNVESHKYRGLILKNLTWFHTLTMGHMGSRQVMANAKTLLVIDHFKEGLCFHKNGRIVVKSLEINDLK